MEAKQIDLRNLRLDWLKIRQTIFSCITKEHLENSRKLIIFFFNKWFQKSRGNDLNFYYEFYIEMLSIDLAKKEESLMIKENPENV